MNQAVKKAIQILKNLNEGHLPIIEWACPVPVFGNFNKAEIATVGINPSNIEFFDFNGIQLKEPESRLPTLRSLDINHWSEAAEGHSNKISKACEDYFFINPYKRWFDALDRLLSNLNVSFYSQINPLCHFDLVPFATEKKWGKIPLNTRNILLDLSQEVFAQAILDSKVKTLILNGKTVVNEFQILTNKDLNETLNSGWNLERKNSNSVEGKSYLGSINQIGNRKLGREIRVLGFNHNIQSSFGVTKKAKASISKWISNEIENKK